MTEGELFAAIDGLMAYDRGATDSGVRDEDLRARVRSALLDMQEGERRRVMARFARRLLTDASLDAGYGVDDVVAFDEWTDGFLWGS